mgnify:CR=1 FL=1
MKVLRLIADTNLFLQCKSLAEIDWASVGPFDEFHIIVTSPIQKEIDRHKNKGNDRRGKRSRSAAKTFREIVLSKNDHKVMASQPVVVKLLLDTSHRPAPDLAEQLDYTEPDNQLVGITATYCREFPDDDVRLLTHDTGPMVSAKTFGIAFLPIDEDWLLDPESIQQEKQIQKLKDDLTKLRNAEPVVDVVLVTSDQRGAKTISGEFVIYEPLPEEEIERLLSRIRMHFPLATQFESPESSKEALVNADIKRRLLGTRFTPPSNDEILEYQNTSYPSWLIECEAVLGSFHDCLSANAKRTVFSIELSNHGSRPGKDVLIALRVSGDFRIRHRNKSEVESAESLNQNYLVTLPAPPSPPKGRWESPLAKMADFGSVSPTLLSMADLTPTFDPGRLEALQASRYARAQDAFYWKEGCPDGPVDAFEIECKQWRHGIKPEIITGEILLPSDVTGDVAGALSLTVHAENLSANFSKAIPVRISVTRQESIKKAEECVEALLNQSKIRF